LWDVSVWDVSVSRIDVRGCVRLGRLGDLKRWDREEVRRRNDDGDGVVVAAALGGEEDGEEEGLRIFSSDSSVLEWRNGVVVIEL
jgi:hypothetical protein